MSVDVLMIRRHSTRELLQGEASGGCLKTEIAAGSTAVDVPPTTESSRSVNEKSIVRVRVDGPCYTHGLCVPWTLPGIDFWRVDRIGSHRRYKAREVQRFIFSFSFFTLLSLLLPFGGDHKDTIYSCSDRGPTLPFIFFSIGRMPTQIQGTQRFISMQIHGSLILWGPTKIGKSIR